MAYVYEDMTFEKEEGIAIVTFNRPEKLNALSAGINKGLMEAIREVEQDSDIRVIIITGAGERGFCSGADVSTMGAEAPGEKTRPTESRTDRKEPTTFRISMLRSIDKPVIAAVNGVAAGAGLSIALACDIRIASENASFISAFIKRGLAGRYGVTYLLPRIMGIAQALELMWTGDRIDAREAERLGIVSQVVPAADLMKETKAFALRLAKQPPIAMKFIKQLTYEGLDNTLKAQLSREDQCAGILRRTEDYQEGIKAFKEKRESVFKGI